MVDVAQWRFKRLPREFTESGASVQRKLSMSLAGTNRTYGFSYIYSAIIISCSASYVDLQRAKAASLVLLFFFSSSSSSSFSSSCFYYMFSYGYTCSRVTFSVYVIWKGSWLAREFHYRLTDFLVCFYTLFFFLQCYVEYFHYLCESFIQ